MPKKPHPKPKHEPEVAKKVAANPRGPRIWTEQKAEESFQIICERLALGESLRSICMDKAMPGMFVVLSWLRERPGYAAQYAHARELQAEGYADSIVAIADGCDDPAKARVQIDARKWIASKLLPKKYGEKTFHEVDVNVQERREKHIKLLQELEAEAQKRRALEEGE